MDLENTLRRRLPGPAFAVARAAYGQRPAARRERKGWAERQKVAQLVAGRLGDIVLAGPFAGLRLGTVTPDSPAKLLGSYEAELHQVVEQLIGHAFATIVNVGSAEGYYAIGMALRCPDAEVVAYELDGNQQSVCRANAGLNGVEDRVSVRGECTNAHLRALDQRSLVIMDCEGCEDGLLSAEVVATVLVELHDWADPTLPDRVIARFQPTHVVEIIWSSPRDPAAYPQLDILGAHDRELALFERPKPMRWALIRPLVPAG